MQKKKNEILVLTALTVGLIWTILELTPKSALLSLTILYCALYALFFPSLGHTQYSRRLMGSTDQADPSCFYFKIS